MGSSSSLCHRGDIALEQEGVRFGTRGSLESEMAAFIIMQGKAEEAWGLSQGTKKVSEKGDRRIQAYPKLALSWREHTGDIWELWISLIDFNICKSSPILKSVVIAVMWHLVLRAPQAQITELTSKVSRLFRLEHQFSIPLRSVTHQAQLCYHGTNNLHLPQETWQNEWALHLLGSPNLHHVSSYLVLLFAK